MRRNRRHRAGSGRGSVSSCSVAASTYWTMITTAIRRHMVARSPATVVETKGFIVSPSNAPSVVVSVSATRYKAAEQKDCQHTEHKGEH
ncbi:MAG: hypothetical protein ACLPSL_08510 [Smithella sp.]